MKAGFMPAFFVVLLAVTQEFMSMMTLI